MRLWLLLLGLPWPIFCGYVLYRLHAERPILILGVAVAALALISVISLFAGQFIRPLQTLSNVIASLRQGDYSFRVRGGRSGDSLGDLAHEVNGLASGLQAQRANALDAIALVEQVMSSMQSPVLAFDSVGRLCLLNAAAEDALHLHRDFGLGLTAQKLELEFLLNVHDGTLLSLPNSQVPARWMIKRTGFRLRGIPHTLVVLSDVSNALRDEERLAWERIIRVLAHEINNSLTPIKSIAGSLRTSHASGNQEPGDLDRGLEVIEDRAESLNRFLQGYRQLKGLPTPLLRSCSLAEIVNRVASLETRMKVDVESGADVMLRSDPDQMQQSLINLVRNAAEAALSQGTSSAVVPEVAVGWECIADDVVITIRDNGRGLTSEANLFVPFYTTKPNGTGIGLVLAKQIVEAHGGSLRLINRADGTKGCCAILRMPVT